MPVFNQLKQLALSAGLVAGAIIAGGCASTTTTASAEPEIDEVARGREQMIRAIDAAWVRVIASGKDQEILDSEPAADPGAANGYVVRLADCLPLPDLTPYPEEPVGLLKKVLDSGQVRRLVQDVPQTPGSTTEYFSGITDRYFEAVIEETQPGCGCNCTAVYNGNAVFVVAVPGGAGSADLVSLTDTFNCESGNNCPVLEVETSDGGSGIGGVVIEPTPSCP